MAEPLRALHCFLTAEMQLLPDPVMQQPPCSNLVQILALAAQPPPACAHP